MGLDEIIRDILVVLVAGKLAAELAERIGIPSVVGEILAGLIVGPSVMHLVGAGDEVLRTLGEIGVILLLLEVGLGMDLAELGKVGRASILVAAIGVITPMVLGIGAMEIIGADFKVSLFIGAALTATSVGITARVFGDLRALATTEARIVLGAAVADDVMGLVVLTVVVRIVTGGSVSALSVGGIVLLAVAFLGVGGIVGVRAAPRLFGFVDRCSRSTGTVVVVGLAFALAFAQLASAAHLAPIVGAFVAGIALSGSAQSDHIRRELAPVGHIFIPVFFLQIGIDAQVGAFAHGAVLRDAALLLVVATVGKIVAAVGTVGTRCDKVLVGLGMLPRGEVGLIFATIGLDAGILSPDLYAALLLVVLVTTLATPQLLKIRYARVRHDQPRTGAPHPPGVLQAALEAAIPAGRNEPPAELLAGLVALSDDPLPWDGAAVNALLDVIERGNARSWRFLEISGVLDKAAPEMAVALRQRHSDPFSIDPLEPYRLRAMERLRRLDADDVVVTELRKLANIDRVLLAALLAEIPGAAATLERLGLDDQTTAAVLALVSDRELMWSAARQPAGLDEAAVFQLASHLDSPEKARELYVLSALRDDGHERWEARRLGQLHELVQAVLHDPGLTGADTRDVIERRREEALKRVDLSSARERVVTAPRSYVLRHSSDDIARHAEMLVRFRGDLVVESVGGGRIEIAGRDRPGFLASTSGALAFAGLDIEQADVSTWSDGVALESFRVSGVPPGSSALADAIRDRLGQRLASAGMADADVSFDSSASPWHTVCEVRSPDEPGVLHALACALAAAGVDVHSARIGREGGTVIDRFEVTSGGAKLGAERQARIRALIASGVEPKRLRWRRR